VTAPGLSEVAATFDVDADGAIRWLDEEQAATDFGLVDQLLTGAASAGVLEMTSLPAVAATLDTRPFFHGTGGGRRKLGLGSSAALTTALMTALRALEGRPAPLASDRLWLSTLVSLHRMVQGGRGSGIDIATSALGGVIRYRVEQDHGVAEASHCELPADLLYRCVWTGRAASTQRFLQRLDQRRREDPLAIGRVMGELADVAAAGTQAIVVGDTIEFMAAVSSFTAALERLGEHLGLPVLSREHQQLRHVATTHGVSYKPSGAGGGDFGLAFSTEADALDAFCVAAASDGFEVIGLEIEGTGSAVLSI
jgi:phosphomevalonate kinase